MKLLIVVLLIGISLLSMEGLSVNGYDFVTSVTGNGSLCRQQNPMQLTYYNAASSSDTYQVPLAAEAWNDVPAFLHFSISTSQASATITVTSIFRTDLTFYGHVFTPGFPDGISCSNGFANN